MTIKLGPVLNAGYGITQHFGENPANYKQYGFNGHEGVDFSCKEGIIVASATPGQVLFAGDSQGPYGLCVILWDHDQNCKTVYAHLSKTTVNKDALIPEGSTIGITGNTGVSTGPHLHFGAMRTKSERVNRLNPLSALIQSAEPANPDNGYKGWENPEDMSIFEWPVKYYEALTPKEETTPVTASTAVATYAEKPVAFDEIFTKYYAGWNKTAALADFNIAYGGDLNKLLVARGITTGTNPAPKAAAAAKPVDLGIPGQLEFDTTKARALWTKNTPGVYLTLAGAWIYTTIGIPNLSNTGGKNWSHNSQVMIAAKGGYNGADIDGGDYHGYGEDRIHNTDTFVPVSANALSIRVDLPPTPAPAAITPTLPEAVTTPAPSTTQAETPTAAPTAEGGADFSEIKAILGEQTTKLDQILSAVGGAAVTQPTKAPEATKATAGIFITSRPTRAGIYIDGNFQFDYTPSNFTYQITPGKHLIRLTKKGYKIIEQQVDLKAGTAQNLNIALTAI